MTRFDSTGAPIPEAWYYLKLTRQEIEALLCQRKDHHLRSAEHALELALNRESRFASTYPHDGGAETRIKDNAYVEVGPGIKMSRSTWEDDA